MHLLSDKPKKKLVNVICMHWHAYYLWELLIKTVYIKIWSGLALRSAELESHDQSNSTCTYYGPSTTMPLHVVPHVCQLPCPIRLCSLVPRPLPAFQCTRERQEGLVCDGSSIFEIIAGSFLTIDLALLSNLTSSVRKTQCHISDEITAGKPRNEIHSHA